MRSRNNEDLKRKTQVKLMATKTNRFLSILTNDTNSMRKQSSKIFCHSRHKQIEIKTEIFPNVEATLTRCTIAESKDNLTLSLSIRGQVHWKP